ncbi:helix-turn-helix DNA binding domain protein [Gordonia phage Agueybana]|uniref:Helix-turn-helix DNA binding domain protein n=1 Tax=Gordonia phage Agueybana TaxID=2859634 RepID=A0AC61N9P1_9CAUD|nr:helix-turn-helix DNA binding domain protein [Gordonia phage Agueybana]QYC54603.1 helix-turn-helix DNA binding domain protein [Gordonia phage Agueybana]
MIRSDLDCFQLTTGQGLAHTVRMHSQQFEIAFVVEALDDPFDARITRAEDSLLGLSVANSGSLTTATSLVEGDDAVEAAITAARALDESGITVMRSYPDLVTRSDIAERLERSRQCVGLWIRGERMEANPFPSPASEVAGGVWLWRDVVDWARKSGIDTEGVEYPSLADHARIDLLLQQGVSRLTFSTYASAETLAFSSRSVSRGSDRPYQRSYDLDIAS